VNFGTQTQLETIFREFGEERWARKIAQKIVMVRAEQKILTSEELAKIICNAIPGRALHQRKKHPATKVFMALRIAVNRELEVLETFLDSALEFLNPGARMCFLSFHSLEDRIVKKRFKDWEGNCTCPPDFPECVCHPEKKVKILTRKAVRASDAEVAENPMARSACLRVVEKL